MPPAPSRFTFFSFKYIVPIFGTFSALLVVFQLSFNINRSLTITVQPPRERKHHHAKNIVDIGILQQPTSKRQQQRVRAGILPPDDVLEQWKRLHSWSALLEESGDQPPSSSSRRQYLVVQYSCPQKAGNLLHDVTSALLLAVATNRTFVVRYQTIRNKLGFQLNNETTECNRILQRQDWVPQYENVLELFNYTGKDAQIFEDNLGIRDWSHEDLNAADDDYGRNDVQTSRFVRPSSYRGLDNRRFGEKESLWKGLINLQNERSANFLSQKYGHKIQPQLVDKFYSLGIHYLYGLLLWQTFQLKKEFVSSTLQQHNDDALLTSAVSKDDDDDDDVFAIGIHSRHVDDKDDGTNTANEIECLKQLLAHHHHRTSSSSQPSCSIHVMSDRSNTVDGLVAFAESVGCSAVYAIQNNNNKATTHNNKNTSSTVLRAEHGVFAGEGFFRDLVVAANNVNSGFAGYIRSSSMLVFETIQYLRKQEAWLKSGVVDPGPLPFCFVSRAIIEAGMNNTVIRMIT